MDTQAFIDAVVRRGLVNAEAAERLTKESAMTSVPVEQLLVARRLTDEASIAQVKSELSGVPYRAVSAAEVPEELFKLIPLETVQTYRVIPIEKTESLLVVGMIDPQDVRAQDALTFIAKANRLSLGVYLVTPSDLEAVLRRYTPYRSEIESAVRSLNVRTGEGLSAAQKTVALNEGGGGAGEAPIIRIVSSTLREAVDRKASDIHIEPMRGKLRIRFRVDGELSEASSFPVELQQPIVSRIKILSDLKIDEARVPQDGRFRTMIFGRDIDFRVATFPTPLGEKVALRVLDPTVGLKGIENLGLVGWNARVIREGIERPFGMVLITGPTGSGKTTTLYALLQILNKPDVNVVSLEDPVEYFVEGINQSQVRPEIGYDFASGLRQILRQDPDIIMVGEIRDEETAELSVHAALTGHIVLSTLHTNNAVGVIPRLADMGVQKFLIPSAVNVMVSQRLLPRLCPSCAKPEPLSEEVARLVEKELAALRKEALAEFSVSKPYVSYHAAGCEACHGKGVLGRLAIFEALSMTSELKELVSEGATEGKIVAEARRQGMVGMRQDGILKALQGLISLEEVLRETVEL